MGDTMSEQILPTIDLKESAVPATTNIFAQVEDALGDPRILDRELIRELLDLSRALEATLIDVCRANMELKAMDSNVAASANALLESIDALKKSYTEQVQVDEEELARFVEAQLEANRTLLRG